MLNQKWENLSPTAQRLADALLRGDLLWMPHPKNGPQISAYTSEADVLYFGGAAGGGKSDLLLGLAVTDHTKSIIFRREYKQLRELEERSREILEGTGASYSGTLKRWRGIPGGKMLEFGAVQLEKDKENYKGRPHDLIGFDEVPDFTESQFRYLMAWNRSTDPDQRVRVVATGNPPTTPEGRWVIKYWKPWLSKNIEDRAQPGELRWFAVLDNQDAEVPDGTPFTYKGEKIIPYSKSFIPAFLHDNPYFTNTDYYATLQSLPEPMRSQLLYGDFLLEEEPRDRQVIPSAWIDAAVDRWLEDDSRYYLEPTHVGIDPSRGGKDQTAFAARVGTFFKPVLTYEGSSIKTGQALAAQFTEDFGDEFAGEVRIDVIGIGASAFDQLTQLGYDTIDINFAAASQFTDRSGNLEMYNRRAEAYWNLREALDPVTGDDLCLPPDEELAAELAAPTWDRTIRGIKVVGKDKIRQALGRSPNKGDAVAMCYMEASGGIFFG